VTEKRGELWNKLKLAREAGADLDVLDDKAFVSWTEVELQNLHDGIFGSEELYVDRSVPVSGADAAPPVYNAPPVGERTIRDSQPQSVSPDTQNFRKDRAQWPQYRPQDLARMLGVPFTDRGADRAGLTINTHGPEDPLRVDNLGRVWYMDEVAKPSIPRPRMVRRTRSTSSNVVTIATKRPDGGLDETFEIAGQEQHEITIKTTLPSSQVGIYVDPRMPFKIHQYGGRRGFDYEEVRNFYGGLDLIPTRIKEGTIYIGLDLCFDLNKVRDEMERELRERTLEGRR
jgi:hypothetical protein